MNAGAQPSAARQMLDGIEADFLAAAELAGTERVRADMRFMAGYYSDVSEALRSGNLGVFLRLSGEAESAVARVRTTCRPVLANS